MVLHVLPLIVAALSDGEYKGEQAIYGERKDNCLALKERYAMKDVILDT